jgi:hypothetical protein
VRCDLPGDQVQLDLKRSAMRHCRVALKVDQQPVLEAEQHDQWQNDDSQRDPEDAAPTESRAPESPEKRPGHTRSSEVASNSRVRRLVAFHDGFRPLAESRGGMGHARG